MSKARLFARLINSSGDVEIAALDNIIDSAPGALDTLNELAAAINDDANVYTTLTNSIATKADTSSLATVATSGLYSDLSGAPVLANIATSGLYSDLSGAPTLATVATSGLYSDLSGLPTLYSNTDVATYLSSNGYDTATNIIATITDSAPSTLDTLNELAAAINDDASFATTITTSIAAKADTSSLATVATTGDYDDLIDKPTILTQAEAEDDATAVAIALG
jgi:hypothetical protein